MNQEVRQQVECVGCTWNKNCIEPPAMTKEEVEAKLKIPETDQINKEKPESDLMKGLMSVMFFGGKDKECIACPAFIERLREGPDLSNKIKEIMRAY